MKRQSLDVIIVNFNSTDYTIKCLNSVFASAASFKLQVIVVDNDSYDYPERIKHTYPDIELIINKKNYGFSKAVNFALNKTTEDIVVLLNPDTITENHFFEKAIGFFNKHENVGVLGPKILDIEGTIQGSARRFPNVFTSIFGRKSPLTRLFPNNPITKREFVCFSRMPCESIDVDWVSGACMVLRNRAIEEVGGFDERFFMYWEDTDLCKAMKDSGWRTVYFPNAHIYHHIGGSSDTEPIKSIYNFHKSCYLLCLKHAKGIKKAIIPIAFWGLSMRCLTVMALNYFTMLKNKKPVAGRKKQYYN